MRNGYAPHHKFPFADYLFSGFHSYADSEIHYPGESLRVGITFPSWASFSERVRVGQRVDVLELSRLVGHLIITEIHTQAD